MTAAAISFGELMHAIEHRRGIHDVACPLCGPDRRKPANRTRKVLRVWNVSPAFISYVCVRCGESGYARERAAPRVNSITYARVQAELFQHSRDAASARRSKALALWRSRQAVRGSIAETYLRARGYPGPFPPTLGFLPGRADYPPALISAFGLSVEIEASMLTLPEDRITGVHLTRLARDGSDRERGDKAKIMIGFSKGSPIVLAPWTDGLAVVITEGIEDALSAHHATGLCAWAAGSASRLPALADAVPTWVECVTILADNDPDGRRHAGSLAVHLKQLNVEVRLVVLGEPRQRHDL